MEYEKHLVGIPQWRQQLQNTWEKVQATHVSHWYKNNKYIIKKDKI